MSAPSGDQTAVSALPGSAGPPQPAAHAWLVALIGWTTLVSFYHLDGGARFEPIDCWVAQTAREMLAAKDWLVPRFSGETRMQKSPGPYWAVMLTSIVRGTPVDEVSARIPNAVAAIVLVFTIFWLTRHVAGDRAAVFAGFAASSSVLILWWSHRGASDLGLTTCTTLSLAALWIASESTPAGWPRVALWLLGYFAAGVGMLYKMPMPLVVVGLPALLYVLLRRRWAIFHSRWHLLGLLVFLLPWLPWAIAITRVEPDALTRWKVEFVDRFTGNLPNVEDQRGWPYYFTYLAPLAFYCLPFTLSLPLAFARALRRQPGIRRDGTAFMVIWFLGLLAFFTASTGKEWRYFLPALPPLFVLLGIELAAFFNPNRRATPTRDWAAAIAVWTVLPLALAGSLQFGLRKWFDLRGQFELHGQYEWKDLWLAAALAVGILAAGFAVSAWLYVRRREHASFGAIVVTMWLAWAWVWPQALPLLMSQRPFIDFAEQLKARIPPGDHDYLRQVGSQDSRIIWYSDVRFPRLIDQFQLLREQHGHRDRKYELRRYGEEMMHALAGSQPILLVAALPDFYLFLRDAPSALGRPMPPIHLWFQTRYGPEVYHFVLFGNSAPPDFPEPELRLPAKWQGKLDEARRPAPAPATRPAAQPTSDG